MTEQLTSTPPAEFRSRREMREAAEAAEKEARDKRQEKLIFGFGKAGVAIFLGVKAGLAVLGHMEQEEYQAPPTVSVETQQEIEHLMDATLSGTPEMERFRGKDMVEVSNQLRHEVASEYGLEAIDPRQAQTEIAHADSIHDIEQTLAAFSKDAGIKVTLFSNNQDIYRVYPKGLHEEAINTAVTGKELTPYKANVISVLDGIASMPKDAYQAASNELQSIVLSEGIWFNKPDGTRDYKSGKVSISEKIIHLPIHEQVKSADGIFRHEYGHILDVALHNKGILNYDNDTAFSSIKSQGSEPSPSTDYTTEYGATNQAEDRADTFRYAFKDFHPITRTDVPNLYAFGHSEVVQKKMNLEFSRLETLKPGLGKFLVKTAPYSANSAPYMVDGLEESIGG